MCPMLEIYVPEQEGFDEASRSFYYISGHNLRFEHSLKSISRWEEKYCKPFFNTQMTNEEALDYFRMMSLDEKFDDSFFSKDVIEKLSEYLSKKPTATVINSTETNKSSRIMTSEVIYAYMANARVPFEAETWNIHRLLTLLGVIGEFNKPPKKMSQKDIMSKQASLNAMRKAKMGTTG